MSEESISGEPYSTMESSPEAPTQQVVEESGSYETNESSVADPPPKAEESSSYQTHETSTGDPEGSSPDQGSYSTYESSNSLDEIDLGELVAKVKRTYADVLSGRISRVKAQHAIGLLIDHHRQYERERGVSKDRVICVFPNCADIVVLRLHYVVGNVKQELNLSLVPNKREMKVMYHKFGDPEEDESSEPQGEEGGPSPRKQLKAEEESSSIAILCPYKNERCCHLQSLHDEHACRDCCLNKSHYPTNQ